MSSKDIEEVLFKQGILFDLDIGRWAGIRKLDKSDLLLSQLNPNAIHLGHKRLIPKEAIEKVTEIEGKARHVLAKCSSEFPIAGARFVRYPMLEFLITELTTLKAKFLYEAKELIKDYPKLRAQQLDTLNAQARALADEKLANIQDKKSAAALEIEAWFNDQKQKNFESFPEVEKLESRFRFQWRLFKVSSADSLSKVSAEQAIEAHQKLQADLNEWIEETAVLMHKTLGQAAANAKALLEKQGKLNPKNLKPLFDAFDAFKAVDFTESDLQKKLMEIKEQFAVNVKGSIDYELSAEEINNSDDAKKQISGLLSKLGDLAIDKVAEEAGAEAVQKLSGFKRSIKL